MRNKSITIIDYGVGNVRSIYNGFASLGVEVALSNDASKIMDSDGVILPGVGAFKHAMEMLDKNNLIQVIQDYAKSYKPLIGICLGMQLLFTISEEFGETEGLNLIPGKVVKFPFDDNEKVKLPNIGWNEIKSIQNSWGESILENNTPGNNMYFVHSYLCVPDDDAHILSISEYGGYTYCSTAKKGNIYGCQYHPEKSSISGLKILSSFNDIVRRSCCE